MPISLSLPSEGVIGRTCQSVPNCVRRTRAAQMGPLLAGTPRTITTRSLADALPPGPACVCRKEKTHLEEAKSAASEGLDQAPPRVDGVAVTELSTNK